MLCVCVLEGSGLRRYIKPLTNRKQLVEFYLLGVSSEEHNDVVRVERLLNSTKSRALSAELRSNCCVYERGFENTSIEKYQRLCNV